MAKARIMIGLGSLIVPLCGCTLMEMNRDSDARERRIAVKQQQLYEEGERNKALVAEQQQLEAQRSLIRAKEDELNKSLEASTELTAQMRAATQQQKRKRQELEARIRKIKAESETLKLQPDTDAKQQKLESLQKEARHLHAIILGDESVK